MPGSYRLPALYLLLLFTLAGCQSLRRQRAEWYSPIIATAGAPESANGSALAMAEWAYDQAQQRESDGDAACVDYYFQAAVLVWPTVERQLQSPHFGVDRSSELYRSSLIKLISAGQHYRRLDPRSGLTVWMQRSWQTIPTRCYGFAWQPQDIDYLMPAGQYSSKELSVGYCCSGLGVATVATHYRRPQERFRRQQQLFPATVVLRPQRLPGVPAATNFVIELYNPLTISSTTHRGQPVVLTRDLTAPFAYTLSQTNREYLAGFLQPGSTTDGSGLFMLEPYQPGKIPVVFVHGLLSNRFAWANIANEIHADPELVQRIQIWGFEYDTGGAFLRSAADLRRQLVQIRQYVDPAGIDPALQHMVLVGHSMGGLIAKLQVTNSGTQLWDSVSRQPFESIRVAPSTRHRLAESFFFEPSPYISRVVFIGTPHRGSPWAARPLGQLASKLVDEPADAEQQHKQLICDNPGVFSDEFARRLPTSVDLLEPSSRLLNAIDGLPFAGHIQLHTIAGYGYSILGAGDSDRIVPLDSARKPGVVTERLIHAKHQKLHQNSQGVQELLCILKKHSRAACDRAWIEAQ